MSFLSEEFNNIFKDIFKEIEYGHFQIPFSDSNVNSSKIESHKEENLRNKMLEDNHHKDNQHPIVPFDPFNGNKNQEDVFPHFSQLFNFPLFGGPQHRFEEDDIENDENSRSQRKPMFPWSPLFSNRDFEVPSVGGQDMKTSTFKYSTVTKKINPDGSVETITKHKDSDGNIEETTTRSLDGQSYTITEKKTPCGDMQTNENFINMDKDELKRFQEKWKDKDKEKLRKDTMIDLPNQEDV